MKLTVKTDELPERASACQAISEVDYRRTLIHGRKILMPLQTRLLTIRRDGTQVASVTNFDRCREWSSTIRFSYDVPEGSNPKPATPASPPTPVPPLPPGLRFEARIQTPLDEQTAAAGDPIVARLRSKIQDKVNGRIFTAGAKLNGRLVRLEVRTQMGAHLEIGIQWESLEMDGKQIPIRAVPAVIPTQKYAATFFHGPFALSVSDRTEGIGTYLFPPGASPRILSGLDSAWITIGQRKTGKTIRKTKTNSSYRHPTRRACPQRCSGQLLKSGIKAHA